MNFLNNTSIRIKVLIAPIIMILTLGILLSIAIGGMENQRKVLTEIQEISATRFQLVQEFITACELVQSDVYRISVLQFMDAPESEILPVSERLNMGWNNLSFIYGEILTEWSLNENEKALLQELSLSLATFRHQTQQAVRTVSDNPALGLIFVRSAAIPFNELRALLSKLLEYQNGRIAAARDAGETILSQVRLVIISTAIVMALVAMITTVNIGSKQISNPILAITAAMGRLTDGDLSALTATGTRQDEIGQMGKALEVFRNNAIDKALLDQQLQESEKRFKILYNNAEVGLFRTRISDGAPIQINWRFAQLAGYESIEDCLENFVASDHYADPVVRERMLETLEEGGEVSNYEAEIIRKDKQHIWVSYSARGYFEAGYIEGALIDITDKKNMEGKLVSSLLEKETLLKEIHHRVKNNFMVISSLLGLQSSFIDDEKSQGILQVCQDRVNIMAQIHTMLYQSTDLARVDFGGFIKVLVSHLEQSYGRIGSPIVIHTDIADVALAIEKSIPCGLILNELVSNALKYAFPAGEEGRIDISMKQLDGQCVLKVRDTGIGFPESLDLKNTQSLGLELVNLLTAQIGGKLAMQVDGGTLWEINFPV